MKRAVSDFIGLTMKYLNKAASELDNRKPIKAQEYIFSAIDTLNKVRRLLEIDTKDKNNELDRLGKKGGIE